EGALHLDDVLTRRTRISIEAWDRGVSAAPVAAALMAGELGWDDERRRREIDHYLARVAAERASQLEPDDAAADRLRLAAPALGRVAAERGSRLEPDGESAGRVRLAAPDLVPLVRDSAGWWSGRGSGRSLAARSGSARSCSRSPSPRCSPRSASGSSSAASSRC